MATKSMSPAPVLDVEATLARFGGDQDLFAEMAGYLIEDAPRLFSDLSAAVAVKNAEAVRTNAHALKGLVAGCGGTRAASVAQSLEDAGQASDLSRANVLVESLNAELDLLFRALEPYRR